MPIIRSNGVQEKEVCRFRLDVSTMDKVRQYCEWAGVNKVDEFFQQAAEYILSKDRDWVNHISSIDAATVSDITVNTTNATSDQ